MARPEVSQLTACGGEFTLKGVVARAELDVGSPRSRHCEDRSDEHHKQDPQKWVRKQ
ncbi:hypothetical protein GCM10022227_09860 [Streptomyces sedi]